MTITQQLVKELFEYKDGVLYWKIKFSRSVNIGDKSGFIEKTGYCRNRINGKQYASHRLIYLYHHGYLPEFIDHIDNNPLNNRIENLREATAAQNQYNKKINKNNTSGVKGVHWHVRNKKWQVQLRIDGKPKSFGSYHDIEVAKFIAETMRHKYHGQFANHGDQA